MNKRVIFTILMFLLTVGTSFSMTIGPIYFNHRIDGSGGYQEYDISNDTFSTRRYKIMVIPEGNNKELTEQMEKWIEVYPKVLTIPPKSSGKVKVLIKADNKAKTGEYKFVLSPTPITIPSLENKNNDSKLAIISTDAAIHFSMGLNSYVGNLGDIKKDLSVTEMPSDNGLKLKVENKMKREVAIDVVIDKGRKKRKERDLLMVKPGQTIDKNYIGAEKLIVSEAPTEKEIVVID